MFVQGPMSFYTLRFLLGITEAGFFPGVMLYLTYWYPAARRSWATGLFYMGLPIANMFGNPLSGGLLELDGLLGMDGIHWMFLVESLLAVVAGFICPFVLVDRPANARWLTQDEKEHLSEQIAHEEAAKHEAKPISWKQAMLDPRILYFCLIYLCIQASVYGLTFFLPKQVVNMTNGEAGLKPPLITAIPWAVALIGVIILPKVADRRQNHAGLAALMLAFSGIGIGGSAFFLHSPVPALILLSIAANKVPGAYCACVADVYQAQRASLSNNANLISMGSQVVGPESAKVFLREYLAGQFDPNGRSGPKVERICEFERSQA